MEPREQAFYAKRQPSLAHEAYIQPQYASRGLTEMRRLIEQTFGHHIAVFDPDRQFPAKTATPGAPLAGELAAYFYKNHYVKIELHPDVYSEEHISIDRFVEDVAFARVDRARNNLFFLLGDVGTGKTALINYLITLHGLQWVQDRRIWFIRQDVDRLGGGRLLTVNTLVEGIVRKVLKVFKKHRDLLELPENMKGQLKDLENCSADFPVKMQNLLSEFVLQYKEITGRTLFLIIDNLDYIYHIHDRVIFSPAYPQVDENAIRCLSDIEAAFRPGARNGFLELGANILFSLRKDSYTILSESRIMFHPANEFQGSSCVYSLVKAHWRSVIQERGSLLRYAISREAKEGQRRIHETIIEPILDDLEFPSEHGHSLMDDLLNIANFGLRDVIEFLAEYSWLGESMPDTSPLGYERLIRSYPVGLLVFILGRHRRFSQAISRFPNIYLVSDQEVSYPTPASATRERSPHTYWLNRLILEFIRTKQDSFEEIRLSDILDCFCIGSGAYSEALVRASLGNMAQANLTNLLQVRKVRDPNALSLAVDSISLTARGKRCLQSVFDKFFYLQLIVDDYLLPLPKVVAADFRLDTQGIDYGYLCLPFPEYGLKLKEMVQLKARQVSIFLEVLAASFKIECDRYKSAFDNLRQMQVSLPNPSAIRSGVHAELRQLVKRNSNIINIDELNAQAVALRKDIDEALRAASPQVRGARP